jgi:VIT1/CCC1 family predicted Fe2+/Mn2+ transporter
MTEPAVVRGGTRGGDGRSVAAVVHDILGNVDRVMRSEIRLAIEETREEIAAARDSAAFFAAGAALSGFTAAFVLLAAFLYLSTVVAPWLAALILAIASGAAAGGVIVAGLQRMRRARSAHALHLVSPMER